VDRPRAQVDRRGAILGQIERALGFGVACRELGGSTGSSKQFVSFTPSVDASSPVLSRFRIHNDLVAFDRSSLPSCRRLAWVLISAGLLVAAVPPYAMAPLGWVALVPLVVVLQDAPGAPREPSPWRAAVYGAIFGAASTAGMLHWLWHLSAFNLVDALALGTYLALYPSAWCASLSWLRARGLPWVPWGGLAWTLLHVLRARVGFLSDPWDPLAYTQTRSLLLLQAANLGGEPLVGLVVCIGNLALARAWLTRDVRSLVLPAAVIMAIHAYGLWQVRDGAIGDRLAVAVIQPGDRDASATDKLDTLRALTLKAAADRPELIIWPESAVGEYLFDPNLEAAIANLAREANAPILFGSADFGKYGQDAGATAESVELKNQVFLVAPGGASQGPYAKNRLVPFAEWVPWSSRVAWPRWIVARQIHGLAGDTPGLFHLDDGGWVGVLICWENLFTDLSRRLVEGGASAVMQLTNDSDFEGPAESSQHNAASILRAIEYGRPVVVASTTGPSLAIDSRGRISSALSQSHTPAWMMASVNRGGRQTVYSRFGLQWLWLAAIVALGARAFEVRRRSRDR
jgi:apolipoprotein N-acyltransferase